MNKIGKKEKPHLTETRNIYYLAIYVKNVSVVTPCHFENQKHFFSVVNTVMHDFFSFLQKKLFTPLD